MLHPVDLATSKVMAAAGRREPRDLVDLLTVHDRILRLEALVWAAIGKTLGFTPESLINEIRRLGRPAEPDEAVQPDPDRLDANQTPGGLSNFEHTQDRELTYTSNAIEGNTLTAVETTLVIEKGITGGGKPLHPLH